MSTEEAKLDYGLFIKIIQVSLVHFFLIYSYMIIMLKPKKLMNGNVEMAQLCVNLCKFGDFRYSNILKICCALETVLNLAKEIWLLPDY